MDSLSQLALGAAVGVAVMGRRTAVWKAALWGGVCATLPDLDSFIDHGDAISNMTLHRADTHALFWLTLAAPAIAWLIARLHGEMPQFRRWWLAVWLALVTHPLLDTMTVYGTQLGRPFTDHPYGVGSIFIIDPLYTLPLLVGVIAALGLRDARGLRWNRVGLLLSTAYLGWGFAAQQHVKGIAAASLAQAGIAAQRVLVTPTPFNTVLWRVVAITPGGYHEGFYSLLDREPRVRFDGFDRGEHLHELLAGQPHVERIAWFSRGFFKLWQQGGEVLISDLRMGQEPNYTFTFVVARRNGDTAVPVAAPTLAGRRADFGRAMDWLWRRAAGQQVQPPR
ncbi:metal-dependent hydrolase [Piscinibacter sp.]|uniref:metal-dependent hydrolase n=1 Tax=Piscinibacter sp. TaxID=1903157 RepID=UPI002B99AC10|nr:metal-dependent hydrolase [Albitalea sp.]HUG25708.1 metal-dependent hydrolase [Albitalea sp.]